MAMLTGVKSFFGFGLTIFGYFFAKHMLYTHSVQQFNSNQIHMMKMEDNIKEFYVKKFHLKAEDSSNQDIYNRVVELKNEIGSKYSILNEIIEPRDFVIED